MPMPAVIAGSSAVNARTAGSSSASMTMIPNTPAGSITGPSENTRSTPRAIKSCQYSACRIITSASDGDRSIAKLGRGGTSLQKNACMTMPPKWAARSYCADAGGAEDDAAGASAVLPDAAGRAIDAEDEGVAPVDAAGTGADATVSIFGLSQLPVTR